MLKILQAHLLHAFVANLKIDVLYPESFCDKNLAVRKFFAFSDSGDGIDCETARRHSKWDIAYSEDKKIAISAFESISELPVIVIILTVKENFTRIAYSRKHVYTSVHLKRERYKASDICFALRMEDHGEH